MLVLKISDIQKLCSTNLNLSKKIYTKTYIPIGSFDNGKQ